MRQTICSTIHRHARLALLATSTVLLGLPVATLAAQSTTVTARDAFAFETPAGRKVTAVFVILENRGSAARAVVSGATAVADTLELHEMKRGGGMMQMSPVKAIDIPAGGTAELRPGGLHLMLFGVRKPLVAGDTIAVTLTLDDGTTLPIAAEVRKRQGMMR
ncbi:MAG: copper chaperone PCu(A)C [Gemmatimonadota bacterium]